MSKRRANVVKVLLVAVLIFSIAAGAAYANPFKKKGKGSTKKFKLPPGIYRFDVEHKGFSNFKIVLKDSTGKEVKVLAEGVGPYKGQRLVKITKPAKSEEEEEEPKPVSYLIQAEEADGVWIVAIRSTGTAPEKRSFSGDTKTTTTVVTRIFKLPEGKYNLKILHQGGREFEAVLYDSKGNKVMELGKATGYYKQTKTLKVASKKQYIIEAKISGKWSVDIEEVIE